MCVSTGVTKGVSTSLGIWSLGQSMIMANIRNVWKQDPFPLLCPLIMPLCADLGKRLSHVSSSGGG